MATSVSTLSLGYAAVTIPSPRRSGGGAAAATFSSAAICYTARVVPALELSLPPSRYRNSVERHGRPANATGESFKARRSSTATCSLSNSSGRSKKSSSSCCCCLRSQHRRRWHFGKVCSEVMRTASARTRTGIRAAQGIDEAKDLEVVLKVERKKPLRPVVERFNIHHEQNVSEERLKELGVSRWSKWGCGPGVTMFWQWQVDELVYISKGSVEVVPDGCEDGAYFYAGDLVRFPKWFEASFTFEEHYEQYYKFFAYGD